MSAAPHLMASERVRSALAASWYGLCDGLAALTWYTMAHPKHPERGDYRGIHLRVGERTIEISISPTARSVIVWVDGKVIE